MLNTIIIVVLILCVLLALVILIQNPKGGGLSSSIGGFSNNTMGVQQTNDTLVKTTWGLMGAIALLVLITGTSLVLPDGVSNGSSGSEQIDGDLNKSYPGEPKVPSANQSPLPGLPAQGGQPEQVQPAPTEDQNAAQPAAPAPADKNTNDEAPAN